MELIADIFLGAGAIGAGFYCFVLGRRLNRFNDLEKGVGGAVAVLSAQVDDLTKTLTAAQGAATKSADTLTALVERAEDTARCLEMQMASLHDLPGAPEPAPKEAAEKKAASESRTAPQDPTQPMFVRRCA
jgi:hypothetical protein